MSSKTWSPDVGKLMVRVEINPQGMQTLFCFRNTPHNFEAYTVICKIENFVAMPCVRDYTEEVHEEVHACGLNQTVVHRHYPSWEELKCLKKLWETGPTSFDEWARDTISHSALSEFCKDRLWKVSIMR